MEKGTNEQPTEQKKEQTKEPSKTAIYVSNLPFSLDDEGLKNAFKDFDIKSSTIAKRGNGRSKGFGFVEFNTVEDQQKALKKDGFSIDGREIVVKVANNYLGPRPNNGNFNRRPFRRSYRPRFIQVNSRRNSYSLFVTNLPFNLNDKDVEEIFAEFKPKSARVATGRNGRSKGFAFVEFYSRNDQQDALEALDQCEVNGRIITVRIARSRSTQRGRGRGRVRGRFTRRRRNTPQRKKEPSPTMLFVSNLPFSWNDEQFKELFKDYDFKEAYVATYSYGRSKGFGFVDLVSNEEQKKALEGLKDAEADGRKLTIQIANKPPPKDTNNENNDNDDDNNDNDDNKQDENNDN